MFVSSSMILILIRIVCILCLSRGHKLFSWLECTSYYLDLNPHLFFGHTPIWLWLARSSWPTYLKKEDSFCFSKLSCITWKSGQIIRATERHQTVTTGGLNRSDRFPGWILLSFFTGESASPGEQRAPFLGTRERRAAAFIMSCPDVMRPLYGHYAPHAPGETAFVRSFPVSFLPLYWLGTIQKFLLYKPVYERVSLAKCAPQNSPKSARLTPLRISRFNLLVMRVPACVKC